MTCGDYTSIFDAIVEKQTRVQIYIEILLEIIFSKSIFQILKNKYRKPLPGFL